MAALLISKVNFMRVRDVFVSYAAVQSLTQYSRLPCPSPSPGNVLTYTFVKTVEE